MSDNAPISTLADLTNRTVTTGTTVSSSDHEAWRNDLETRIANINDALADLQSNYAGTSAPTDNAVEGKIYADTNTDPAILKYDPDGSGADIPLVGTTLTQTLTNKTIAALATASTFGTGGTATHKAMGVIDSQYTTVGNVGAGEDDLMSYTLPANTLDTDGKALRITAYGRFGGVSKAVVLKFHFGTYSSTLESATPGSQGTWRLVIEIKRDGTTTQRWGRDYTSTSAGAAASTNTDMTEDETGAIIIKFTGQNSTDATNDVVTQNSMTVEVLN